MISEKFFFRENSYHSMNNFICTQMLAKRGGHLHTTLPYTKRGVPTDLQHFRPDQVDYPTAGENRN